MRIVRMLAAGVGASVLALAGVTTAQADDRGSPGYRDHGNLSCGEGQVVKLHINYNGAGEGKVHYNITRTHVDVVELPVARGGGEMSYLPLNTWQQSSAWNIWMPAGGVAEASAECVERN